MSPLSRRQFLQGAGSVGMAAALGTLAGCTDGRPSADHGQGHSSTTTTGGPSTSTTSTSTPSGPPDWSTLAASLAGTLVLPTNPSYATDKVLYNQQFDASAPQAIAYCAGPPDVQRCIEFARTHQLAAAARAGGHSYGGYSTCSGLVVDVTSMAGVTVAAGSPTATVGAGARLIDIYSTLGQAGFLLPGGSCPTVGIAGLTLGGGVGVFGRNYGLTCDQLTSVDMVTADGQLLTCNATENEDLYWASRGGGGGNFGVVTSFTFTVHPIPAVALFTLDWPWTAAADVLSSWLAWLPTTPDELWSNCQLLSSGIGGNSVRVTGVYCGTPTTLSSALRPLRAAVGAATTNTFVGSEPYLRAMMIEAGCENSTVAACHLPGQTPTGTLSRSLFAATSLYVDSPLPTDAVTTLVAALTTLQRNVPQVGGGVVFDSYGGAVGRVPADATAFVHRAALAGLQFNVSWDSGAPASVPAAANSWLAGTTGALSPYASGAYVNYIDPNLATWQGAYYGANLPRLVSIKRAADPDNFFHFAQSIPTSLGH